MSSIQRINLLPNITKFKTDAILVPTVKHTGTHYLMYLLRGQYAKLLHDGRVCINKKYCNNGTHTYKLLNGHFDVRADTLIEMSRHMKTVIPLRHPALIAVSWKKRPKDQHHQGTFLDEWMKMCEVENALHFPMETKPFDALEAFTGIQVIRHDTMTNSIGNYPEKENLKTIQNFLKDDWLLVEQALNTSIGRKFYEYSNICWL